ncbi:lipase chaperone [Marinobacter fuscus]|uniref:Lipase chaperone n=1 Tax=Marinobacter fuscus TaxID=2109942 RepID=A0A2T1K518_9GAMM|nr:lipase secretion chaperone [Marinobacter fuscus]PSF05249.1 lipase chaperone [Marinobacter fuscus]
MKHPFSANLRWLLPVALLATMAGGGLWLWSKPISEPSRPAASVPAAPPETITSAKAPERPIAPISHRTPAALPGPPLASSLAGTDIDGALKADSSGQLIVDPGVRDFFDYFLSAVGEITPEAAIGRIRILAQEYLPASAAHETMVLLDQYLAYKQTALQVMQTELDPDRLHQPDYQLTTLGHALGELKQLRRTTFTPDAHQAFFGAEEAYSEYTLATMGIQMNPKLSAQGKQTLIEWHRSQLPEGLRQSEQRLHRENRTHQARLAVLEQSRSAQDAGRKLIELGMGADTVAGIVDHLEDRQAFARQFSAFQQAIGSEQPQGLAAADQRSYQEALLKQHFPDPQSRTWARLRMLDAN